LGLLDNLEVDAGLTYIENEPIGKVRTIPLYNESYRLLTSPGRDVRRSRSSDLEGSRPGSIVLANIGHAESPHYRSRPALGRSRSNPDTHLELAFRSLYPVKTGRWASVMPAKLAETLGLADTVRSIPIVDPLVNYSIGLVVPQRDPMTPLIAALVHTAREVAPTLES
jgi:DNA-binding transcriptional LysR family regulator